MSEDTRKNILEVDVVQSIDKTDTVLVNDSGSLKQVSVETLVSSGVPDQYVTESELNGKGYATTTAMNSGLNEKIDKNQGISNSGKYLSVGSDGNVKLVDAPSSGGGIIEETDPTVPAWAKNPTKPIYTADEVGALSDDTEIPTKTSDLTNDSGFITNEDIPEKLPNPQKIIFTGAVSAEYDGSSQQTINIPTGGGTGGGTTDYNDLSNKPQLGGVTLEGNKTLDDIGAQPKGNYLTDVPQASSTTIGGIKAENAGAGDTVPVKIKSDGTLAVPTYPEATGGSANIPRQEMQNTDTTVTLEPNKLYVFPEMTSLTVTLGTPSDEDVANEWHWFFDSGETACVFTLQNQDGSQVYTDAYSIDANMRYEVSVLHNVAYIKGVATGAA